MFIVTNILYPPSLKQADLINTLMLCFVTTFMIKFIAHNAILNAYLTMTGELLRFADKEFFNEWWSVSNYQSYYRKWNLLVHDWIHAYVYLDLKKIIGKKLAVFGTILVSAIVHEYLLAMGTRFILPIITVLFAGMGGVLYLFKPFRAQRASNFFILGTLNFGSSIIIFFLILEFAARQYCPVQVHHSYLFT
jgi:sterol O-acyltransferase